MPNRLAAELSPYLLQHADNPVDWYPWGEEAFARARADEKPIFLSVGYSTCHWCHVMERESFEDRGVAELLNRCFVPVKVDREERPDVDRVYMAFVQATTGAGGWPMSVWLTPALKPFFGGTYFPPASRWGRPGFADVLRETARLWADERSRLLQSAETLTARLRQRQEPVRLGAGAGAAAVAGADTLDAGVAQFHQAFDGAHGGFGGAPKFPRPAELLFLLREHARTGGREPLEMAAATLRAMAAGGMRDHVGGGFHRYSVDAQWRIPHFEKMLYDQAQLAVAFLEAGQAAGDRELLDVADETLDYVLREMTGPEGAFFSAEDADSLDPAPAAGREAARSEGAFYLWTQREIEALLGDDAAVAVLRYGVEPDGNALQDPNGELRGKNQLYVARPMDEVSRLTGRSAGEAEAALARARERLRAARARRPRPHRDDKVLTAWNGLMIAALARAAHVLECRGDGGVRAAALLDRARRAARFVRGALWDAGARVLRRRYRGGRASIPGYGEDYAFLTWGLLELFQADGDVDWLRWSLDLQARHDELFWDADGGGWFSTTGDDASVLLRLKEDYDGAEPSAGSVAAMNLLTLARLTGDVGMRRRLDRALARFGPRLGQAARVMPLLAAVLSSRHAAPAQIVVVGERSRPDAAELRRRVAARYLPFAVRVNVEPGEAQAAAAAALPFVAPMRMLDGKATAYVCSNFVCQAPTSDPDVLEAQLRAAEGAAAGGAAG